MTLNPPPPGRARTVPALTCLRSASPVEMCLTPNSFTSIAACSAHKRRLCGWHGAAGRMVQTYCIV
jgi:hypothetical protein